ncbi:cyclase family protein [bacterium]|nr:cyclase family protein [bacterium]
MAIHDVTLTISRELPVFPGDPEFRMHALTSMDRGDEWNNHELVMGTHTGTHIDAPLHFFINGRSVDRLDPAVLVGPVLVMDVRGTRRITDRVLNALEPDARAERILFLSDNTARGVLHRNPVQDDYVALDKSAAEWLVRHRCRLAGIDAFSIAPEDDQSDVHTVLLEAEMVIIEGLDLAGIGPGMYWLAALPLKIEGADGAPARVFLMDSEDIYHGS